MWLVKGYEGVAQKKKKGMRDVLFSVDNFRTPIAFSFLHDIHASDEKPL